MTISRSKLLASLAALLALVAVAATPGLLGHRVASAFDALAGAEKNWLALGAILFVARRSRAPSARGARRSARPADESAHTAPQPASAWAHS